MSTRDEPTRGVAAEAGRLVADAVSLRLVALVEALREPSEDTADAAAPAPSTGAPQRRGPVPRLPRAALRAPARAAADALATVAAGVVPRLLERIDLNPVLARIDVEALVARVDVAGLVERVDVNRVVATIDVDAVVQRVDAGALAREAVEGLDIGEVIRESTATVGSDTVEAVRVQGMRADGLVATVVDRMLLRRRPRRTGLDPPRGPA